MALDFKEELEVSPGTRKVRRETVSLAEAMERLGGQMISA